MTALLKVDGNGRSKLFVQVLAALISPETKTNPGQWEETVEGQDEQEAKGILEGHEVEQVAIEVANAQLAVDLATVIKRSRMLQIIVSYLRNDSGTVTGVRAGAGAEAGAGAGAGAGARIFGRPEPELKPELEPELEPEPEPELEFLADRSRS